MNSELIDDVVDEYLHWRKVNPHIKGGENYLKRLSASRASKPVGVDVRVLDFLNRYATANAQWFQKGDGLRPMPDPSEAKELLASLAHPAPQDVGWQDIETYKGGAAMFYQPRGGNRMTLSPRIVIDNCKPYPRATTHWMPLPTAPFQQATGGGDE